MAETLNVKDFGAYGNGQNDDTNAFLDTISHAKENDLTDIYIPTGTYIVTRGFNLDDNFFVYGDGIDETIIKLKPGLPRRIDNRMSGSIFMGRPTYGDGDSNDIEGERNSSTTLYNVVIKNLSIYLGRDENNVDATSASFPTMGGILFYNPENCIIDSVKITNPWIWGISFRATLDGASNSNNVIKNCYIKTDYEWYISKSPILVPRSSPAIIGIELTSYEKGNNNGVRLNLDRLPEFYTPSKTHGNQILNNTIINGSHGISFVNCSSNLVEGNTISGCSNRGIIASSCSDNNIFRLNNISNIGSAGILLGYNAEHNLVEKNTVVNTIEVEGVGIKCGVQGNFNTFRENIVTKFYKVGIGCIHGGKGNIFENNKIDGGDNPTGKVGVKISSNEYNNYTLDNLKYDNKLDVSENVVIGNHIENVEFPIKIVDEVFPNKNESLLQKNTIGENFIIDVAPELLKKSNNNTTSILYATTPEEIKDNTEIKTPISHIPGKENKKNQQVLLAVGLIVILAIAFKLKNKI